MRGRKIGEKLFSQKGCDSGLKILVDRDLKPSEIKNLNSKLRTEQVKFPSCKVVEMVGEIDKKLHIDFIYKAKPKETVANKIDKLISAVKEGKIKPPRR